MPTIAELFTLGYQHQQAGHPQEAEQILRQVLTREPRHGGALHLLGLLAYQGGQAAAAAAYFRQAVAAAPGVALFHSSLGTVCQTLGQLDEARRCHEQALRLAPGEPFLLNNLGITLAAQGNRDEACAVFRQAVGQRPGDPELLSNLAAVLRECGLLEEAGCLLRQALRLRPDFAQAHNNLGNVLRAQGQLAEALACYRRAVQHAPQFARAYYNLGMALHAGGRLDEAGAAYRQALHIEPAYHEAATGLGHALVSQNRLAEAVACYQHALRIQPDSADAHNGLGNARAAQGKLDEAVASYGAALRLQPDLHAARCNLAVACAAMGRLSETRACLQEVLRQTPGNHIAHSTYLMSLNYDPQVEGAVLLAEHRRWAERHAPPLVPHPGHDNPADPERRLRVGYVSPDFRAHAVAFFLEPILAQHDPERVETVCYAQVAAPDATTAYLKTLAGHWRDKSLSDDDLAEQVRRDRIDILVDLAGHTADNRLRLFARQPAPVQVSYLGYPATTGVAAIAYRLVDALTDPPGEPICHTEELVRLPLFCCYAPPRNAPPVSPLPAGQRGTLTFGSLHKLEKLNPAVLDLWCRLLHDLPGARLLLCRNTLQGSVAEHFLRQFRERGVGRDRLEFRSVQPVNRQHLSVYNAIDVALDPFPWGGHTTACEALWMGVPVLTLRGRTHAGRMVASVLAAVGLTDLIAEDPDAYRANAVRLAADVPGLAALRARLRSRMASSPLCDGIGFTRALEEAYRHLWRRWCLGGNAPRT
jgi:predicted O-linked N-acetylglucosamine transferase (SPINDLY family)